MVKDNKWTEIGKWQVKNPANEVEEYIVEKTSSGGFRIKNDFGNIKIEMDEESARRFADNLYDLIDYYVPRPNRTGGFGSYQDPMYGYDDDSC